MQKRLISGIVCALIICLITFTNIPILDTIIVVVISMLAMHEYNKAFKNVNINVIPLVGYLGCLSIFLMGGLIPNEIKMLIIRIFIPLGILGMFIYIFLKHLKVTIIDISVTVLSLAYIPFMFSFLKLILLMPNSRVLIWFAFTAAFASDTFAYLVGAKFGKKKLCPIISPKKTVEGSLAGIIAVIITYIIVTIIGNKCFGMNLNIVYIIVMGIVAAVAGQLGDLSASAIKRYCNVKDFGTILPGHGGILDRFDSVLFVAPIVYIFLSICMFF